MRTPGLFDLTGKTAVVTGARRGIGMAMAVALAEAGADIIGVSANLEAEGSVIEQRITSLGRQFTAMTADFADRAAVRDLDVGMMLYPTGNKQSMMWEVEDELGNKGWVSSTLFELAR